MCAIKAWSISSACKNLRAQHPLRAEILCLEICPLGWVNMHLYDFLVCGPKFTRFLLSNVGGVVIVQLRVRFLTCGPVPGIFAIKVESCQKSRRNLDDFLALPNFRGRPSKSYTHVMTPAWRHIVWKMFCGYTPTGPEVIGVMTLNFKPNFKFSRLEFFGGPLSHFQCALSRLGQSIARVKI